MKNTLKLSFLAVLFIAFVGCTKDNSDENKPNPEETKPQTEPEFTFDSTTHPLNVLQLNILNGFIGKPKMELINQLKTDKVSFEKNEDETEDDDEDITELTFIAEAKDAPFKRYKVKANFQNVADLDKRPYELYDGVASFEIVPVDEAGNKVTSTEFKKVFDYFHVRFNALQPSKKAYKYIRKRNDLPPYFVERDDYADFIQSMDNPNIEADGQIEWTNNPTPWAENSSKAKNTPTVVVKYDYDDKTYNVEIAFNYPNDFYKNIKK
ncbi:hypothetical protein [Capnocytophaga felis]|uniref:Lipoprotein n=1 Tax=Capnocytophaga felis TaxID=2267611 RepID=A0A5M4B6X0_9FLAO|nr:hypothetical protein [Capnocytophaga felis]GET45100.1 hypothetical protein RCZ01_04020 [Capnocytophaga felis]GET47736.1 hypothetical protein RCZ02_05670 [Capnocytophaga felis]